MPHHSKAARLVRAGGTWYQKLVAPPRTATPMTRATHCPSCSHPLPDGPPGKAIRCPECGLSVRLGSAIQKAPQPGAEERPLDQESVPGNGRWYAREAGINLYEEPPSIGGKKQAL